MAFPGHFQPGYSPLMTSTINSFSSSPITLDPLRTNMATNVTSSNISSPPHLLQSSSVMNANTGIHPSYFHLYTPKVPVPVNLRTGFIFPADLNETDQKTQAFWDPKTLSSPEYLHDVSILDGLLDDLIQDSIDQETGLRAKTELNLLAQSTFQEIWKTTTYIKVVRSKCEDRNDVEDKFENQTADFNAEKATAFANLLEKHNKLCATSLYQSLFCQTSDEIKISRLIHSFSNGKDFASLKIAAVKLAKVLGQQANGSLRLTQSTTDFLKCLFYFIGLDLISITSLQLSSNANNNNIQQILAPSSNPNFLIQPNLLDLVDLQLSPSQQIQHNLQTSSISISQSGHLEEPLSIFLLKRVLESISFQWASSLTLPTLEDVLVHQWMKIAVDSGFVHSMTEVEIVKLLTQVPWASFVLNPFPSSINPNHPEFTDKMKINILVPLKAIIAIAAPKNFVTALILISKMMALISKTLPSMLTATCIGIVMRGPWPAKLVSIPSLQLYDWTCLDSTNLNLLFGELYHLFQTKPSEYATSSRQVKAEHRENFANFLTSNQPMMAVAYQVDPALAKLNFQRTYPILFILSQMGVSYLNQRNQLAGSKICFPLSSSASSPSVPSFDLSRLIAEELLYFATTWTPSSTNPNFQLQTAMLRTFRMEATDSLHRLCQEDPRLYSFVLGEMHQCSTMMPNFDWTNGLQQLQPHLMVVDDTLTDLLAFLLVRRTFHPLPPTSSPNFRSSVHEMAEAMLRSKESKVPVSSSSWQAASMLFTGLPWATTSPINKLKAVLIICSLGTGSGFPPEATAWRLAALSSITQRKVLQNLGPIPTEVLLEHLTDAPNQTGDVVFTAIRVIVALSAVLANSSRPTQDFSDWLLTNSSTDNHLIVTNSSPNGGSAGHHPMSKFTFPWLWDSFGLKSAIDSLFSQTMRSPVPAQPKLGMNQNPGFQHDLTNGLHNTLRGINSTLLGSGPIPPTSSRQPPKKQLPITPLLLLQQVVHYYAHCIKHSNGQLQKEISVFFNSMIDQMEAYSPGSSAKVLSDLFNESLGYIAPAEISATDLQVQQENRALWLTFWVYALIPRLPKWKTCPGLDKVLDAFAYTSFFSQAKFGEIVNLLPGGLKILETNDINSLMSQGYPWLAYLLIWSYYSPIKPSSLKSHQTATAEIQKAQVWKWYEAANSPFLKPQMSLIFWERFFWCHFETGAQLATFDYLPEKLRIMVVTGVLSVASQLDPNLKPLMQNMGLFDYKHLYNNAPGAIGRAFINFLTWNKNIIFSSGANLLQPLLLSPDAPEHDILQEIQLVSPVPTLFAVAYNPDPFDLIIDPKPYPVYPPAETAEFVASMINLPQVDGSPIFSTELKNYQHYLNIVNDCLSQVLNHKNSSDFSSRSSRISAIEDIEVYILQMNGYESDMEQLNSEYMRIIQRLWKTNEVPRVSTAACSNTCRGAAHIITTKSEVVPSHPGIAAESTRNRQQFTALEANYASCQRWLANSIVILEDTAKLILDSSTDEDSKIDNLVYLFFEILPLAFNQLIPDSSKVYSSVIQILLLLGRECIQGRSDANQIRFFHEILEMSSLSSSKSHDNDNHISQVGLSSNDPTPRSALIELFTPTSFIHGNDYSVYIEMLLKFVKTQHHFSFNEEASLMHQFDISQHLPILASSYLDQLFPILELAAVRPPMSEFVAVALNSILQYHTNASPAAQQVDLLQLDVLSIKDNISVRTSTQLGPQQMEIVGKVIRLVLLACPHNPVLGQWEMIEDGWLSSSMVQFIISALPSPSSVVVASAVNLMARITRQPGVFDVYGQFDLLAKFFKALFSNSTDIPLVNKKNYAAFTTGLEFMISICEPNMLWPIYLNILTQFFAHNSGWNHSPFMDVICGAPWERFTGQLTDPNFVVNLAALSPFHIPLVRTIFSKIDWLTYAAMDQQSQQNQPQQQSQQVDLLADSSSPQQPSNQPPRVPVKKLHFLNLFCKINLLAPTYLDAKLRRLVLSVSTNPSNWYLPGKHLFDWRSGDQSEFAQAFRGDSLASPIKYLAHCARTVDPAGDLKENIKLLYDVSRFAGSTEAIEVCLQEIEACTFIMCRSSLTSGHLWHLPLHDNIDIVSNYIIPLTQQYHDIQSQSCQIPRPESGAPRLLYQRATYSPLVSMLKCVKLAARGNTSPSQFFRDMDTQIPFSTSKSSDFSYGGALHSEIDKTVAVIRGLVFRFVGAMDADLCLAILHVGVLAHPIRLDALCVIWEETLRSYFVQSTFNDQLSTATNAVVLPDSTLDSFLVAASQMRCPLSARIVLERNNQDWTNYPLESYTSSVCNTISFIASFVPPQNREFDLLALWFYVLESVANHKFLVNQRSINLLGPMIKSWNNRSGDYDNFIAKTIAAIANYADDNVHKVPLQLASRCCKIFLFRLLQAKNGAMQENLEMAVINFQKLYPGKPGSEIQRYKEFFTEFLPTILSPLVDTPTFEFKLAGTLVPIAPYLQSFIEGASLDQ